jgi:hypothetical protein
MHPALMSVARVPFNTNTNIVLDGNSMMAFVGGAYNLTWLLAVTSPVATTTPAIGFSGNGGATPVAGSGSPARKWTSDKGILLTNLGISGQTWRKMDGLDGYSSADVDGAFVAGSYNILWPWEGTNSIAAGGRTGMQAVSDATTYNANRRAAHPWNKIVGGTVPPRMDSISDQTLVTSINQQIDIYNAYLLANYKSMGFDAVFDVRQAGSPFNLPDYQIATFNANAALSTSPYWASDANGLHIHLSNIGNDYVIRQCVAPTLRRLLRK